MLTFNTFFISLITIFHLALALMNKDKNKQVIIAQIMMCVLVIIFAIFN